MKRTLFGTILFICAMPLCGGGFEIDVQGARAAGMGGACVAQAADPTAVFCNPGALALIPKKKGAALGVSASAFHESLYQGLPPGVGAGTAAQQLTPRTIQPHLFVALPLGANAVFGTGYYHPFRMHTEWADPSQFAGRIVATRSEIEVYDVTPAVAVHVGHSFGFGVSGIYRTATMSASRNVQLAFNGVPEEVGTMTMASDARHSIGWGTGLFLRPAAAFTLGASYRSKTKADVAGTARLTQIKTGNAQLDALAASTLTFDQDLLVNTTTELPSQATFGIALSPSAALLLELDAERTGWSGVHDIDFTVAAGSAPNTAYVLALRDAWTYRGGFRWRFATGPQLRLGYVFAKSPLPDSAVSAFFPDADRTTITAGAGLDWIDVALGVTTYKQRLVSTSATGLNGNYRAKSWFAVMTMTK